MRKFNPLCFVLRVSRFIGVFPVVFLDKKFIVHRRFLLWSAFLLSIYYAIELLKLKSEVEMLGFVGSHSILFFVMVTFSNINTLLNFVYVFIVLRKLVPLLNILYDMLCELNGKLELFEMMEISVLIVTFSSLSNLCYVFFVLFSNSVSISVSIKLLLYVFKSMSYTCITWHFCCTCSIITLLMAKINSRIAEVAKTRCDLDELRRFFSTLCEICHMLDDFFGCFALFYLILVNVHLQIDLFIVLKNAYNLVVGVEADIWGLWGLSCRLMWVFLGALKVFSFIWAVTRLTSQVVCKGVVSVNVYRGIEKRVQRISTFCCRAIEQAPCWLKSATPPTAIH